MKFEISVKSHAELWGQTLYSSDFDRKKLFGLKTPFKSNKKYIYLYKNLYKFVKQIEKWPCPPAAVPPRGHFLDFC